MVVLLLLLLAACGRGAAAVPRTWRAGSSATVTWGAGICKANGVRAMAAKRCHCCAFWELGGRRMLCAGGEPILTRPGRRCTDACLIAELSACPRRVSHDVRVGEGCSVGLQ